jgi:hypothetical protein
VGRASLDAAMAWAQRRIQERRRRAVPDPRGASPAPRNPVSRPLRGSSIARRGEGLGAAANPGTRASGSARPTGVAASADESSGAAVRGSSIARRGDGMGAAANPGARASGSARPTGDVASAEESSVEALSWVEHRSTRRGLGRSGESRNAGVAQCATHGVCCQRRGVQCRGPFVGRASLDAARAWAHRRIQERGRRAVPDPRGLFSAPKNPVSRPLRGSSIARRGEGLGTAANPGTRASGSARPTGVVFSAEESSGAAVRGSSIARQGDGLGTAANPGTRASRSARPTGDRATKPFPRPPPPPTAATPPVGDKRHPRSASDPRAAPVPRCGRVPSRRSGRRRGSSTGGARSTRS